MASPRLPQWRLFGPVFRHELLRAARNPHLILGRSLFAAFLFWMLLAYALPSLLFEHLFGFATTHFVEDFYLFSIYAQFIAVFLLTPAWLAGVVSEEIYRKRLDSLLVTDLSSTEIVLGKAGARLLCLGLFFLAALPIYSLLQLAGGVEGWLVFGVMALIALSLAGLGGLTTLCSTLARHPASAALLSYLIVVCYLAVCFGGPFLVEQCARLLGIVNPTAAAISFREWADAGNPFVLPSRLDIAATTGQVKETFGVILTRYAFFHGLLALGGFGWAALRLRGLVGDAARRRSGIAPVRRSPPEDRLPMVWKEVVIERRLRPRRTTLVLLLVLMALGFALLPLLILDAAGEDSFDDLRPEDVRAAVKLWVRIVGTAVAILVTLTTAIHAAGSLVGERTRGTFDSLLLTELRPRDILYAKWVGSILSSRWLWPWLGLIWLVGLILGGLHLFGFCLLVLTFASYLGTVAALGLWNSVVGKTTAAATAGALFELAMLSYVCGGPLFAWTLLTMEENLSYTYDPIAIIAIILLGLCGWIAWSVLGLLCYHQATKDLERENEYNQDDQEWKRRRKKNRPWSGKRNRYQGGS